MADISKIALPGGEVYDLKVRSDKIYPLQSKTFTGVVAANDSTNGYLFFGKIFPDENDYNLRWRMKYRLTITITVSNVEYTQNSEVELCGVRDALLVYKTWNEITNTSYRPIYGHRLYRCTRAGTEGGIGHAIGVRLYSSYSPDTYGRIFDIDIIEVEGCSFEFLDTMVTYANLPGTGATNYTGVSDMDGTTQGWTFSGDRNTTTQLNMSSDKLKAGTNNIYPYTFIMQKPDGTWESVVLSSSAGDSGKQANQSGFLPDTLHWFAGGGTITSGNLTGTSVVFAGNGSVDARYSVNGITSSDSTSTMVANESFYLVGTFSNGLFYLDTEQWWTQTLPSTEDGKVYLYVGEAGSVYTVSFHANHPYFCYDDGIKRYAPGAVMGEVDEITDNEIDAMFENIPGTDWSDIITVQEVLSELGDIQNAIGNFHFYSKFVGGDTSSFDVEFSEAPSSGTPIFLFGRLGWSSDDHKYFGSIVFEEDGTPRVLSSGRYYLVVTKVSTYQYTFDVESAYARLFFISPMGMTFPS